MTAELLFPQLAAFRKNNPKKLIFGHYNINSLPPKCEEIKDILKCNYIDVLGLIETKLDGQFVDAMFNVENYNLYRLDRNRNGGGIMCYVLSSLPHRIRTDIQKIHPVIEWLLIEVKANNEKLFFVIMYKPPSVSNMLLLEEMHNICDNVFNECSTMFLLGDLNVNILNPNHCLRDIFELFDLKNIVNEPTCYKNVVNPSLLDVIVTNSPRRLANHLNIDIGLSDFHHIVCAATKMHVPRRKSRVITYRRYKDFNENSYLKDLSTAPLHVSEIFNDPDDQMWFHSTLVKQVTDNHAPIKQKLVKGKQAPFIHGELRKAINVKAMFRRKYNKLKTNTSWQSYRKQRNLVTKLKREAIKTYFNNRCNNQTSNSKQFWDTVKPFLTNKSNHTNQISLLENDKVISDTNEICNVLNDYFINIANNIPVPLDINNLTTQGVIDTYSNHPSIKCIKNNVKLQNYFSFKTVSPSQIKDKIKCLKTNKATGYDMLPAKLIKLASETLSVSLTPIINNSLKQNKFPSGLKPAIVSPVYKKNDNMLKKNYRPISILTSLSKVFEGIVCDQMMAYFDKILSPLLSAYRKKFNCNNVLVHCIEQWRESLDKGHVVATVLMDLSKAFDSLPHGLLLAKLNSYGVSLDACDFIRSYLGNRPQQVKIGQYKSSWQTINRGIPQGSLTGPMLFNFFLNDIFYYLSTNNICNYADDNTLYFSGPNIEIVKENIENVSNEAIDWFSFNYMEANPDKFQAMFLGLENTNNLTIDIANNKITPVKSVKLLGIHIDNKLNFDEHVSNICLKASRQINTLKRISKYLNFRVKSTIYHSFIVSNFSYCPTVYNQCLTKDVKKLEKLNSRALSFVYDNFTSSYKELLQKHNKASLHLMRAKVMIELVFKILNSEAPPIKSNFFKLKSTPYDLRANKILELPKYRTIKYGKNSYGYQGAKLWNLIPNTMKDISNFNEFKQALLAWNGPECNCSTCFYCIY